jgi:hypothetical protein
MARRSEQDGGGKRKGAALLGVAYFVLSKYFYCTGRIFGKFIEINKCEQIFTGY